MKLQSKIKVEVKGKVIGGDAFLLCVSTRPTDWESLIADMEEAKSYRPDIVEWRIDHYDVVQQADFDRDGAESAVEPLLAALRKVHEILDGIPLLLCFRQFEEGGVKPYPLDMRVKLLEVCVSTGLVDLVDLEVLGEDWFNEKVAAILRTNGVKLIYSHHKWHGMTDENQIVEAVMEMQRKGADIAKFAVIIKDARDAVTLARAGKRLKEPGMLDIPLCFYPLGDTGLLMRLMGDRYGVDYMYCALNGDFEGGVEESTLDYMALRALGVGPA